MTPPGPSNSTLPGRIELPNPAQAASQEHSQSHEEKAPAVVSGITPPGPSTSTLPRVILSGSRNGTSTNALQSDKPVSPPLPASSILSGNTFPSTSTMPGRPNSTIPPVVLGRLGETGSASAPLSAPQSSSSSTMPGRVAASNETLPSRVALSNSLNNNSPITSESSSDPLSASSASSSADVSQESTSALAAPVTGPFINTSRDSAAGDAASKPKKPLRVVLFQHSAGSFRNTTRGDGLEASESAPALAKSPVVSETVPAGTRKAEEASNQEGGSIGPLAPSAESDAPKTKHESLLSFAEVGVANSNELPDEAEDLATSASDPQASEQRPKRPLHINIHQYHPEQKSNPSSDGALASPSANESGLLTNELEDKPESTDDSQTTSGQRPHKPSNIIINQYHPEQKGSASTPSSDGALAPPSVNRHDSHYSFNVFLSGNSLNHGNGDMAGSTGSESDDPLNNGSNNMAGSTASSLPEASKTRPETGLVTEPPSSSGMATLEYNSVILTEFACPTTIKCPKKPITVTKIVPSYTVICPASLVTALAEPEALPDSDKTATITATITVIRTIKKCAAEPTKCRAGAVTTNYSTVTYCPAKQTDVAVGVNPGEYVKLDAQVTKVVQAVQQAQGPPSKKPDSQHVGGVPASLPGSSPEREAQVNKDPVTGGVVNITYRLKKKPKVAESEAASLSQGQPAGIAGGEDAPGEAASDTQRPSEAQPQAAGRPQGDARDPIEKPSHLQAPEDPRLDSSLEDPDEPSLKHPVANTPRVKCEGCVGRPEGAEPKTHGPGEYPPVRQGHAGDGARLESTSEGPAASPSENADHVVCQADGPCGKSRINKPWPNDVGADPRPASLVDAEPSGHFAAPLGHGHVAPAGPSHNAIPALHHTPPTAPSRHAPAGPSRHAPAGSNHIAPPGPSRNAPPPPGSGPGAKGNPCLGADCDDGLLVSASCRVGASAMAVIVAMIVAL
ncbi:hypothetical protein CDD81_7106 [Ophiocordyceps australis]|uniref:Uncharacterized protein n=1 Tax=Ophiocordyceps australis TaxID=1399860 RepID=A0A2C5X964_9HYPO|nr:hypothetical protein CDD81_7106 [Ophiocordyceps australis]